MNYTIEGTPLPVVICNLEGSSTHCFTDPELKPLRTKHSHPELYNAITQYLEYDYGF